jgi:small subunit ribosomal protein S18
MKRPHHRPRPRLLGPSRAELPKADPFLRLGLNPLTQPMNVEILAPFLTMMGKIQGRNRTGLSWKSQRRVGKAVRRARSMGLLSYFAGSIPTRQY